MTALRMLLFQLLMGLLIRVDASEKEPEQLRIPRSHAFMEYSPDESQWGPSIHLDEMQGITHDEKHWYITTRDSVYKTLRGNITQVVAKNSLAQVRRHLSGGYYNHFGDISISEGRLYIATTGVRRRFSMLRAVPIVVVLDPDLQFEKYARFPRERQKGAGWVAVNPRNGHLYSSNPYRRVHEYSPEFENGGELRHLNQYEMRFRYGPETEEEWQGVPAQGGAFSESGLFYYVLDHKYVENAPFTGIHAFRLDAQQGAGIQMDLPGKDMEGKTRPFIAIPYKPSQGKERLWEMEGLTIVNQGAYETLYHLQLHNGPRSDNARLARYRLDY